MDEAEARKARLAAMRARAGGGVAGARAAGGLVTPQMLGAPPAPQFGGAGAGRPQPAEAPPKPMAPMAATGFYSSLHAPAAATPVLEAFSMGDMPQAFVGGRDRPQQPMHGPMGQHGMGSARGGWHGGRPPPPGPPRGRGGFPGPGMQMGGGFPRGQSEACARWLRGVCGLSLRFADHAALFFSRWRDFSLSCLVQIGVHGSGSRWRPDERSFRPVR